MGLKLKINPEEKVRDLGSSDYISSASRQHNGLPSASYKWASEFRSSGRRSKTTYGWPQLGLPKLSLSLSRAAQGSGRHFNPVRISVFSLVLGLVSICHHYSSQLLLPATTPQRASFFKRDLYGEFLSGYEKYMNWWFCRLLEEGFR